MPTIARIGAHDQQNTQGYRTHKNFINMAYLILGKLDLRLPT
ncbi:ISAtfe-like protein [Acidithiobacillus caldus SM-1]|uniref:ISAtfe-like protein n=1 Tax=Acidithiobacillus caldus (strain SM-1) TaxID=990288 RepID=F9ZT90_ACICS|nr:hypothetical protein [Acidithiobacillus caldus]AEK56688.1 ISAtfe-like protein [Acidithiobacillus caldus SM-1]